MNWMTIIPIIIGVLSIVPIEGLLRESVDLIEVNSYFDENGRLVFTQNIFIEIERGEEVVRAWRLVKEESHRPVRDVFRHGWTVTWCDGGQLRQVFSKYVRETWLQYDPETAARETYPVEWRRGLRK